MWDVCNCVVFLFLNFIRCHEFEKKYDIRSEFFFDAYTNGWLDDDGNPDFAEWSGIYKSKIDR